MLKEPVHPTEIQLHEALMILHRLLERATQTSATTATIQLKVEELHPLLALLQRPDAQEIQLGRSLEETLIRIRERLDTMDDNMTESRALQTAIREEMKELVVGQEKLMEFLPHLPKVLQMLTQVAAVQEKLQSMLTQLTTDLFAEEDLAQH